MLQIRTVYLFATSPKKTLDIFCRCGMIESERRNSLKIFLHVFVLLEKETSKGANGAALSVPRLADGKEAESNIEVAASQPKRLPDDSGNL